MKLSPLNATVDQTDKKEDGVRIDVLLVNGEVDEWDDAKAEMDGNLPGSMVIVDGDDKPVCIYAPGMWIKVEFDVEDEPS